MTFSPCFLMLIALFFKTNLRYGFLYVNSREVWAAVISLINDIAFRYSLYKPAEEKILIKEWMKLMVLLQKRHCSYFCYILNSICYTNFFLQPPRNINCANNSSSITKNKLPNMSDFLIAYSTMPGYTAMRNEEDGSWFLKAFTQV